MNVEISNLHAGAYVKITSRYDYKTSFTYRIIRETGTQFLIALNYNGDVYRFSKETGRMLGATYSARILIGEAGVVSEKDRQRCDARMEERKKEAAINQQKSDVQEYAIAILAEKLGITKERVKIYYSSKDVWKLEVTDFTEDELLAL